MDSHLLRENVILDATSIWVEAYHQMLHRHLGVVREIAVTNNDAPSAHVNASDETPCDAADAISHATASTNNPATVSDMDVVPESRPEDNDGDDDEEFMSGQGTASDDTVSIPEEEFLRATSPSILSVIRGIDRFAQSPSNEETNEPQPSTSSTITSSGSGSPIIPQPSTASGSSVNPLTSAVQCSARIPEFECVICQCELSEQCTSTRCGHLFCTSCIKQWFKTCAVSGYSIICPLCKSRIITDQVFPIYLSCIRKTQ